MRLGYFLAFEVLVVAVECRDTIGRDWGVWV